MGRTARIILRKALLITALLTLSYKFAAGQDLYDYRYYKLYESEALQPLTEADTLAAHAIEPPARPRRYDTQAFDYNFHSVRYTRRGISPFDNTVTLDGIRLHNITRNTPRYLLSTYEISHGIAIGAEGRGSSSGLYEYQSDTVANERVAVGIALSTRNYNGGITASTSHRLSQRWSLATRINAQTGRDAHIEGLFTNRLSLDVATVGQLDSLRRLSFALFFAPSERATRQASTAEAFRLTGNNLYNPAWGLQNGKIRNSRVRRSILPTAVASFQRKIDKQRLFRVSLGATLGVERYSNMEWFDAQTAQPDNYRYMPSYFDDQDIATIVEQAWLRNERRYTQIDFDRLYEINRLGNGASSYAIADRVERTTNLQLHATLRHELTPQLRLTYGIDAQYNRTRHYKQMRDLLGGEFITDIDYYLIDDATYRNSLQNDLNNPSRQIEAGDRYGYDYALSSLEATAFASLRYANERLRIDASAEVGYSDVVRRGFYRKELFADNSFGRSRRVKFTPYALHCKAAYDISEQHHTWAAIGIEAQQPEAENLFLQPQYNNRTIDNPSSAGLYSAEIGYRYTLPNAWVTATAFVRYSANGTESWSLYDDTSGEFADMVTSNLDRLHIGLEAEASWNISEHWRTSLALCYASHTYADNPRITLYSDTDNRLIANRVESHSRGLATDCTPQIMASAEVSYRNRGWYATLTGSYAGLRYVEPSLLRRTRRVAYAATSPEMLGRFMTQERLHDAFTLDISLSKSFYLSHADRRIYSTKAAPRFIDRHPRARIIVFVAVRNLLGNRNIAYYGYESSRLHKRYLADGHYFTPQASRYLYAYPRTYYLNVRFVF